MGAVGERVRDTLARLLKQQYLHALTLRCGTDAGMLTHRRLAK
jgi:hypothetical protein